MEIFNRKARFNYEILDSFEAGLALTGSEVKSARGGQVSLQEAYIKIKDGQAYLIGAHFPTYANSRDESYNPTRSRKLLLHKKELVSLESKLQEKNLTLVPLKMYITRNRIKLEVGLARGKKKYDKRETIKKREADLAIRRKTR